MKYYRKIKKGLFDIAVINDTPYKGAYRLTSEKMEPDFLINVNPKLLKTFNFGFKKVYFYLMPEYYNSTMFRYISLRYYGYWRRDLHRVSDILFARNFFGFTDQPIQNNGEVFFVISGAKNDYMVKDSEFALMEQFTIEEVHDSLNNDEYYKRMRLRPVIPIKEILKALFTGEDVYMNVRYNNGPYEIL